MAYESLNQMYTHILDPVRGWWDERQLSTVLPVMTGCQDQIYAGRVGRLTQNGGIASFLDGIPEVGNASWADTVLPLFVRNNYYKGSGTSEYNDNDVRGVSGNISGLSGKPGVAGPDQGISCLVGTGSYELASSEFLTTDSILPGSLLTAGKETQANAGLISLTGTTTAISRINQLYEKTYIGVASKSAGAGAGAVNNYRGTPVVTFYTQMFSVSTATSA